MNLAAMLDLGVDSTLLQEELSKLAIDEEFTLNITQDNRKGIYGTRVDIVVDGVMDVVRPNTHHEHVHEADTYECDHEDKHHTHVRQHGHEHVDHAHGHRTLKDIEEIIGRSGLSEAVKATSLAIFRRVAAAEGKIHGKPVDEVHFHEVGATDSIVDIVGAAICYHQLNVDAVWSSPVELGGGFVRCAHGTMPVPAPATLEILQGIPTTRGAVQKETATPTGAAILAELADRFEAAPHMTPTRTAYGIGHRDTDIPNVLRVTLASVENAYPKLLASNARLLQCNIDDMTGEMLGHAMEIFLEQGAMDVHFTPIVMKKSRPATTLSVLCDEANEDTFKRLIFRHTTTLGIKSFALDKTVLDISFEQLETPLGPVTMKHASLDGKVIRSKPELEDCKKLAAKHGIPLHDVYLAIGKVRHS